MFKVAVAHSIELDSADAATDLLDQCRVQLGDLKPKAGIIFMGIEHDFSFVLRKILSLFPAVELIGGSSAGEISQVHGHADDSIVLVMFCSDELVFKAGVAELILNDTATNRTNTVRKAVALAALKLSQEPLLGIAVSPILIPANRNRSPSSTADALCEGFTLSVGETFPVFGVMSACPVQLGGQQSYTLSYRARQFYNDSTFTRAIPFLLIAGPLLYSFGVASGWVPIGPKERVTKSDHNILHRIGNGTALQFYQRYLGEHAGISNFRDLVDFPLAVFEEVGDDFSLCPTTVLDEESGSLVAVANIPEGSRVQLAHAASRERVLEAAEHAIHTSAEEYPGKKPAAVLCLSSYSRQIVLGTRVEEEYFPTKNSFPDVPIAGFYGAGTFAPLKRDRSVRYQNNTFVNLVLGAR